LENYLNGSSAAKRGIQSKLWSAFHLTKLTFITCTHFRVGWLDRNTFLLI